MRTYRASLKKKYTVKVVGALFVVILVLWSICGIKANAAEKADKDKMEYQLQEAELKSEIRAGLEELGFDNCGITMTKIMDADGSREYTVLVHHPYLNADDTDKVSAVYESLWAIDMADNNMTVNYTIF